VEESIESELASLVIMDKSVESSEISLGMPGGKICRLERALFMIAYLSRNNEEVFVIENNRERWMGIVSSKGKAQ